MPFTPFHLGAALPVKALSPKRFSLTAFALVQVVIDLEVLWNLERPGLALHGIAHTLAGALVVGLVCIVPAKVGFGPLYRWLRARLARREGVPAPLMEALGEITWTGAITGALVGAVTHVGLDGLVHWDVRPLAPWLPEASLWVEGSFLWVHLVCAVAGGVGLVLWWRRPAGAGSTSQSP